MLGMNFNMDNDKEWYKYLSTEEVALAKSYDNEILNLINNLPKGASEELQKESYEKQKHIFDNKIKPLIQLSSSRRSGISVDKIQHYAAPPPWKKLTYLIIPILLLIVGCLLFK